MFAELTYLEKRSRHVVLRHFTSDMTSGLWFFLLWLSLTINILLILAFGINERGNKAVINGSDAILGNSPTATAIQALVRGSQCGVFRLVCLFKLTVLFANRILAYLLLLVSSAGITDTLRQGIVHAVLTTLAVFLRLSRLKNLILHRQQRRLVDTVNNILKEPTTVAAASKQLARYC